jgi:hypothetical protein
MSPVTLQPREVESIYDVSDILEDSLFAEADQAYGVAACRRTCVSGLTWKCDGSTFQRTCVSGLTWRCDG